MRDRNKCLKALDEFSLVFFVFEPEMYVVYEGVVEEHGIVLFIAERC
jgi:hypothetical protein